MHCGTSLSAVILCDGMFYLWGNGITTPYLFQSFDKKLRNIKIIDCQFVKKWEPVVYILSETGEVYSFAFGFGRDLNSVTFGIDKGDIIRDLKMILHEFCFINDTKEKIIRLIVNDLRSRSGNKVKVFAVTTNVRC